MLLMISDYAARRVLAEVCQPNAPTPLVRVPHALGADAVATDGRGAVLLEGAAARLGLPALPDERRAVLEQALLSGPAVPLGTTTLHALIAWTGEYVCGWDEDYERFDADARPALAGACAYDRNILARYLHLLAVATDCRVAVSVAGVTNAAARPLSPLRLAGDGWRACLLDTTPAVMPGPETRLPLEAP